MQKLVFVGNCQIQVVCNFYRQFAWDRRRQEIAYVPSYTDLSPENRLKIESADLIIEQVLNVAEMVQVVDLCPNASRIGVPLVAANFYWPFAGEPRPRNPTFEFLPGGPFPAESGISFLNKKIAEGADPEEAVDALMSVDVGKVMRLDRLFELTVDRQRSRDEATGFDIAEIIENHFRTEHLFLTAYHPNVRVASALITQTFEKVGVSQEDIQRVKAVLRTTPFPRDEVPIHPAVSAHFKLIFGGRYHRYRYLNEAPMTFREYALRYMKFLWNEPLEAGIAAAVRGEAEHAERLLKIGLAAAPKAAAGHEAMGIALDALGRHSESIAEMRRATRLEPERSSAWIHLSKMLSASGNRDDAEKAACKAVQLVPNDAAACGILARLLRDRRSFGEAAAVLRSGISASPRDAGLRAELGHTLLAADDLEAAASAIESAIQLEPTAGAYGALVSIHARLGRLADLKPQIPDFLETDDSSNVEHLGFLAQALQEFGANGLAEPLIGAAISICIATAQACMDQGKLRESVAEIDRALRLSPRSLALLVRRSDALLQMRAYPEAEDTLKSALEIAPDNAHIYFMLGIALMGLERYDEAVKAREMAVQLEPTAFRHLQLAHALVAAAHAERAETEMRLAVKLAPDTAVFYIELGQLLARDGRFSEAVETLSLGCNLDQDRALYWAHLAAALQTSGKLNEAHAAWQTALRLEPGNVHFEYHLKAARQALDDSQGSFMVRGAIPAGAVIALAN